MGGKVTLQRFLYHRIEQIELLMRRLRIRLEPNDGRDSRGPAPCQDAESISALPDWP